jgi:hypothetical protein
MPVTAGWWKGLPGIGWRQIPIALPRNSAVFKISKRSAGSPFRTVTSGTKPGESAVNHGTANRESEAPPSGAREPGAPSQERRPRSAVLRGAVLRGAVLRGAVLRSAALKRHCPQEALTSGAPSSGAPSPGALPSGAQRLRSTALRNSAAQELRSSGTLQLRNSAAQELCTASTENRRPAGPSVTR